MNELLYPPKNLLDSIKFYGLSIELRFPTPNEEHRRISWLLDIITGFLKQCFGNERKPKFAREIFIEVVNNAVEHGNKMDPSKDIIVGLWVGEKGVLFGVLDEGDFFKQEAVIMAIRKRRRIPSSRGEEAGGAGIALGLYRAKSVWLREGVVFFTVLLENSVKNS